MKTVGIAIDDWKLSIFEKHLIAAGYTYTKHPGLSPGTLILKVKTEWISKLQPIIQKASNECKQQ